MGGKKLSRKLPTYISPPDQVDPSAPGRTVDHILADISYHYDDLFKGKRLHSYAVDPETRSYLTARMHTARKNVAAAYNNK